MSFSQVDWFTEHIGLWKEYLLPALKTSGSKALMLGSYDGRSAAWLLDRSNVPNLSDLYIVEPGDIADCVWFSGKAVSNPHSLSNLRDNTRDSRVMLYIDQTYVSVLRSPRMVTIFDAIVIDARGNSREALEAMVLAWNLLRKGGVMVITNYTFSREHDSRCPRRGIDAFLESYADEALILKTAWHVFIQRRLQALELGPCRSELFPGQQMGEPQCHT